MKNMLFIYNPYSGKAQLKNNLSEILDIFTKAGYIITVRPTQQSGDAYDFIRARQGEFELICVSGGDGTLNEAVRGVLAFDEASRPPIGYIPTGTTNDFASNLGIPKDMIEAAKIVTDGELRKVDIGSFNGRTFNYVAAFGAFTDISYETPQNVKNIFGQAAYLMEVVKKFAPIERVNVELKCGDEVRKGEYAVCLVLNSSHVAGVEFGERYCVDLNDGLFEVALIERPVSLLMLSNTIASIMQGKTQGHGFEVLKASEISISTDRPVRWTLDGEFGGETDTAEISVIKGACKFIGKGDL